MKEQKNNDLTGKKDGIINTEKIILAIKQENNKLQNQLNETKTDPIFIDNSDLEKQKSQKIESNNIIIEENEKNKTQTENHINVIEKNIKQLDEIIRFREKVKAYFDMTTQINKNLTSAIEIIKAEKAEKPKQKKRLYVLLNTYMSALQKENILITDNNIKELKQIKEDKEDKNEQIEDLTGSKEFHDQNNELIDNIIKGVMNTEQTTESNKKIGDSNIEAMVKESLELQRKNIEEKIEGGGKMKGGISKSDAKKEYRLKIQRLISYLESAKARKRIKTLIKSDPMKYKKATIEKNLQDTIRILKKHITSDNYVDYEIDTIIETFFPTTYALNIGLEANPKTVTTKKQMKTYMYANPISNEELNPKKETKIRPKTQQDEDFGIEYTVLRNHEDSSLSDMAMSEMLGIENMLYILNQTGANTRYLRDYYHGKETTDTGIVKTKEKPTPMYTNVFDMMNKYTNKLLRPPEIKAAQKKDIVTEDNRI